MLKPSVFKQRASTQVPKPTLMAEMEQKALVFRRPRCVLLPVRRISAAAEGLVLPLGQAERASHRRVCSLVFHHEVFAGLGLIRAISKPIREGAET